MWHIKQLQPAIVIALSLLICLGCSENSVQHEYDEFTTSDVNGLISLVVSKQLSEFPEEFSRAKSNSGQFGSRNWVLASAFPGLIAASKVINNPTLESFFFTAAEMNEWQLGDDTYLADDHLIGRLYVELYTNNPAASDITQLTNTFDYILTRPQSNSLFFPTEADRANGVASCIMRWCWADALYMSPPIWHSLSSLTGDSAYSAFAHHEFWASVELLYDPEQQLFFRDSRFFANPNKPEVFWSRGNGWVYAGIVDILKRIPVTDPYYSDYLSLYKHISAKLVNIQMENGAWSSDLLNPAIYPQPETSGTALFTYGLAWGLNQGVLDQSQYADSLEMAWHALIRNVDASGNVGFVQSFADKPGTSQFYNSEHFGTSAFLLAASAVFTYLDAQ